MMNLDKTYDNGLPVVPPSGRYIVAMTFYGRSYRILEKKIKQGVGSNYLPIFILRHRKLDFMNFDIHVINHEIVFKYRKIPLEDHLKKIDYNQWLGKIFYKGHFFDYFFLTKV